MSDKAVQYLERDGKSKLAYRYSAATDVGMDLPCVMFCGGFKSDMFGSKATFFEEQCRARGQAYLRFDYTGHGASGGAFKDGCIGDWFADAQDIFDALISGPVLVVGSSMGGWIGLLLAQSRSAYLKGFIGIAAAPDFTQKLYAHELSDAHRAEIAAHGYVEIPNEYDDAPYIFTAKLFEDGAQNLLLDREHEHDYPIMLFHGRRDTTVSEDVPLKIRDQYKGGAFDIVFIEDGDHRLSRDQDLKLLDAQIVSMSSGEEADGL